MDVDMQMNENLMYLLEELSEDNKEQFNKAREAFVVKFIVDNRKEKLESIKEVKDEFKRVYNGSSIDYDLEYALYKAWQPAISGICRTDNTYGGFKKQKQEVKRCVREFVNNVTKDNFDDKFKELCKTEFDKARYGVMQKYINITFKYLLCMNYKPTTGGYELYYKCHCPLDTYIAKAVSKKLDDKSGDDNLNFVKSIYSCVNGVRNPWSYFNQHKYERFKGIMNDLCNGYKSNIIFDFLYW